MIGKQQELRQSRGIYEDMGRGGEDVSPNQTVNENPILSGKLSARAWFLRRNFREFRVLIKLLKRWKEMDCSICSPYPVIIRPPRNTICGNCLEGIKTALSLMGSLEGRDDHEAETTGLESDRSPKSRVSAAATKSKGLADLIEWMKRTKKVEDELSQKISFLAGSLVSAFQEELHTDLKIKPSSGPPIPVHRAILAARSQIFKHMLDSDSCKSSPSDTVTIADLSHEELESLLEFLYRGSLAPEKWDKHIYSLMHASHKYEISYLHKSCERRMLENLNVSNALDVLEIFDVCSHEKLKDVVVSFIVKNIDDIAFSAEYEAFCLKNPHLSVQIMRGSLIDAKDRRRTGDNC